MSIDRELLTKALNSVSVVDIMETFNSLKDLGHLMLESDSEDPLNQALERLFNDPDLMERVSHYATKGGVSVENVVFPLMVGLIVGLLTPVSVDPHGVEACSGVGCEICGRES